VLDQVRGLAGRLFFLLLIVTDRSCPVKPDSPDYGFFRAGAKLPKLTRINRNKLLRHQLFHRFILPISVLLSASCEFISVYSDPTWVSSTII
jgi:hypothetical protein